MVVTIEVLGALPPAKGEAKSMLAEGHAQAERVRRLLEGAANAMGGQAPLTGPLGLDLTVRAPKSRVLPDATNMLGGIGDVLQARATGADVRHLGSLATVACFIDDAQIQQIVYRREYLDAVGYSVTVRSLEMPTGLRAPE